MGSLAKQAGRGGERSLLGALCGGGLLRQSSLDQVKVGARLEGSEAGASGAEGKAGGLAAEPAELQTYLAANTAEIKSLRLQRYLTENKAEIKRQLHVAAEATGKNVEWRDLRLVHTLCAARAACLARLGRQRAP